MNVSSLTPLWKEFPLPSVITLATNTRDKREGRVVSGAVYGVVLIDDQWLQIQNLATYIAFYSCFRTRAICVDLRPLQPRRSKNTYQVVLTLHGNSLYVHRQTQALSTVATRECVQLW